MIGIHDRLKGEYGLIKGPERRRLQDRRSQKERRDGWVRIGKWSSVKMQDLKIAKYLQ